MAVDDEFARSTALGALANIYAAKGDREHALSFAADSVARTTAVGHPAYALLLPPPTRRSV